MTQTIAWGTAQWGTLEAGVWTTLAETDGVEANVRGDLPRVLAFILELPNAQFSGSRLLDGPVVSGITIQFPTLEVGSILGLPNVRLSVLLATTTADYSTASPPLSRGETTVGTFVLGVDGGTLVPKIASIVVPTETVTQIRSLVTSRVYWDGRLAFVLEHLDVNAGFRVLNGPSNPLTADMEQDLFYSGLSGGPAGRIRAVRDSRYGMPAFHTELVRDGDNPGLFVRSFDVDPEDEEATYQPKPDEGTVTDEVPS